MTPMNNEVIASDSPTFNFHALLADFDFRLVLDSPNGEYRFEYFTVLSKPDTEQEVKIRKYRLHDKMRGTVTLDPWDGYNLETQARILQGLIEWSHYRLIIITGWKVTCSVCGHLMDGKPWQIPPTVCTSKNHPRCNNKIKKNLVEEVSLPSAADWATKSHI